MKSENGVASVGRSVEVASVCVVRSEEEPRQESLPCPCLIFTALSTFPQVLPDDLWYFLDIGLAFHGTLPAPPHFKERGGWAGSTER